MPIFPIASSKSLADARIGCVFFLALEKIFGANCKGYLRTLPKLFTVRGNTRNNVARLPNNDFLSRHMTKEQTCQLTRVYYFYKVNSVFSLSPRRA